MNKDKLMRFSKAQLIEMLVKERAKPVATPSDALAPILDALENVKFKEVEYFLCVTLNGSHKVIGTHVVSQGLVNCSLVHPREVFRPAIMDNATSIIIAHNHPSGSLEPSGDDRDVTRRLRQAGELLGINVLDHLIVGPSVGYFSFLEANIF